MCRKIAYFSVWKNQEFLLAVLYRTVDTGRDSSGRWTVDSGQWTAGHLGTVDSGQWTVDSGQWTGHPVLDRGGSGQLDSGRDRVDKSTVLTLVY